MTEWVKYNLKGGSQVPRAHLDNICQSVSLSLMLVTALKAVETCGGILQSKQLSLCRDGHAQAYAHLCTLFNIQTPHTVDIRH